MKRGHRFCILAFCVLSCSTGAVFGYDNLDYGVPKIDKAMLIIDRAGYAVGYSPEMRQPLWVSYRLTGDEARPLVRRERTNDFREDEYLAPGIRATLADYVGSGYDRGHLASAADMGWGSSNIMSESFLMSNMSPQLPGFNRGIWKDIESWTRDYAKMCGSVFVFVGPIFGESCVTNYIGNGRIRVPTAYFRILVDEGESGRVIAYIVPQTAPMVDFERFTNTVERVEQESGLKFNLKRR